MLLLAACAHVHEDPPPPPEPPPTLGRALDVDPLRLERSAGEGPWRVAALVEKHLATVGVVHPGRAAGEAILLDAALPTPGYALTARLETRGEGFCRVRLEIESDGKPVATAPWWAIDALERVYAGVGSLDLPRLPALDDLTFARLRTEAAELARAGQDPPLDRAGYIHAPRPITAGGPQNYYAPPSGPSQMLPDDRRVMHRN
jgi:hypothetical protein